MAEMAMHHVWLQAMKSRANLDAPNQPPIADAGLLNGREQSIRPGIGAIFTCSVGQDEVHIVLLRLPVRQFDRVALTARESGRHEDMHDPKTIINAGCAHYCLDFLGIGCDSGGEL